MVTFVDKDQLHRLSVSRDLLFRFWVYSESTLPLFDSGTIPNVMSRRMVGKLHIRMMPTIRRIKVANCVFEKYICHLRDITIQMGELEITLEFLAIENSLYDVIIRLPTMIKLRAQSDYCRLFLRYVSKATPK